MKMFVLALVLWYPSEQIKTFRIISDEPISRYDCEEALDHPSIKRSYLVDFWLPDGPPGNGVPSLMCVEWRGQSLPKPKP